MLSNVNLDADLQLLSFAGRVMVSAGAWATRVTVFVSLSREVMVGACATDFVHSASHWTALSRCFGLLGQVVGCRGRIEINPRDTMSKESSIIGVALFHATEVRNISILR